MFLLLVIFASKNHRSDIFVDKNNKIYIKKNIQSYI